MSFSTNKLYEDNLAKYGGRELVRYFVNEIGDQVTGYDERVWDNTGWGPDLRQPRTEADAYVSVLGDQFAALFCFVLLPSPQTRHRVYAVPRILMPSQEIGIIVSQGINAIIKDDYYSGHNGKKPYGYPKETQLFSPTGPKMIGPSFGADAELVLYCMRGQKESVRHLLQNSIPTDFISKRRKALGLEPLKPSTAQPTLSSSADKFGC